MITNIFHHFIRNHQFSHTSSQFSRVLTGWFLLNSLQNNTVLYVKVGEETFVVTDRSGSLNILHNINIVYFMFLLKDICWKYGKVRDTLIIKYFQAHIICS